VSVPDAWGGQEPGRAVGSLFWDFCLREAWVSWGREKMGCEMEGKGFSGDEWRRVIVWGMGCLGLGFAVCSLQGRGGTVQWSRRCLEEDIWTDLCMSYVWELRGYAG
jgi:hypothetical protein